MPKKTHHSLFGNPFIIVMMGLLFMDMLPAQNISHECAEEISRKYINAYEDARAAYQKNLKTKSRKQLQEIIAKEPRYPAPYFLLGVMCSEDNKPKAALRYFEQVMALCPDFPEPLMYYYLGIIHYTDNEFQKSVENLQQFFTLAQEQVLYENLYAEADNYLSWSEFLNNIYKDTVPFDPIALEGVCTANDEYLPYITVDNSQIFFTRKVFIPEPGEATFYETSNGTYKEQFMMATRQKNGEFNEGYVLAPPFNERENEGGATLSADNRELIYTVCQATENYFNCDLYYTRKGSDDQWQPLRSLGNAINTPTTWESQPTLSPDGNTLFFASDRPGGFGGIDIWKSYRLPDETWSQPENAGRMVNTPAHEKAPFIHPDGQSLYFSSNGWKGLGGYDIFLTRLHTPMGKEPLNLGYPINTEEDNVGFFASADGKTGYYASNALKNARKWDIFAFELHDNIKPKGVKVIKGCLKNEKQVPISAEIEVKEVNSGEVNTYKVNETTGTYTAVIRADDNYLLTVKKEGYAFESKFITKECRSEDLQEVNISIKPIEIGGNYQLNDIYFQTGSYELNADAKFVIDAFVEFLRENPSLKISIEGHTDNVGKPEDNKLLSQQRAKAVYDYTCQKRIRKDRLSYKGWGSERPIADNQTEDGRAKNRRTVFIVTDK